jgi:hypothetical protein
VVLEPSGPLMSATIDEVTNRVLLTPNVSSVTPSIHSSTITLASVPVTLTEAGAQDLARFAGAELRPGQQFATLAIMVSARKIE